MARVFPLIRASIDSAVTSNESESTSAKTGLAPTWVMASAVNAAVIGEVMTSLPGPMPSDMSARARASVPLPTPTA